MAGCGRCGVRRAGPWRVPPSYPTTRRRGEAGGGHTPGHSLSQSRAPSAPRARAPAVPSTGVEEKGGDAGRVGSRAPVFVSSLIKLFFFLASPSRTRSRSPRGGRPGVLSCSLRPPAPSSSLRSQVPARGKECARAQRETRHTLLSFFFDAERFQGAREGGVARPRAHAATGATGSQGDPLSACPGGKGHESADRARRALPFNPRRVRAAPKRKEKKTRSPS